MAVLVHTKALRHEVALVGGLVWHRKRLLNTTALAQNCDKGTLSPRHCEERSDVAIHGRHCASIATDALGRNVASSIANVRSQR